MKNQKGITLVALVITIIVLLILAGVSISLVLGQNGVLTQASNAVVKNDKATAEQEIKLGIADAVAKYYEDWTTNSQVHRGKYFTQAVMQANCPGGTIAVTTAVAETADSGSFVITYTSTSSQTVYTATINIEDGSITSLNP